MQVVTSISAAALQPPTNNREMATANSCFISNLFAHVPSIILEIGFYMSWIIKRTAQKGGSFLKRIFNFLPLESDAGLGAVIVEVVVTTYAKIDSNTITYFTAAGQGYCS